MERLHLPDNMKVHFAGLESYQDFRCVEVMGVQYGLYSAYNAVYSRLFGKKKSQLEKSPAEYMCRSMKHVIQDSGLFSLLYGTKSHLANKETVFKWYDALVDWTLEHGNGVTAVEIDCQDILGTDIAWDLRERMRQDLPNNRIINVFHLSDGIDGLDRLIEFSDYIGVGSGTPENSSATMYEVSSYIKKKKPSCDIHLLGCTRPEHLRKCSFCTSCDSTTWFRSRRYGDILNYHISDLDTQKVIDYFGRNVWENMSGNTENETIRNTMCVSIEYYKRMYQKYAGNQDYTKNFQK